MRSLFLVVLLAAATLSAPVRAFSDSELIDGFNRTVFGSEFPSWGWQSRVVKKFAGPVRVFVDDRSAERRGGEVAAFVQSLPGLIQGLDIRVVGSPGEANYRVYLLDRGDYQRVVTREVYGRTGSSFAPGKCLVRVVSSMSGIARADAVVVTDEGEFLFQRCKVEEVLQGLGPVNDDGGLRESVFNDRSKIAGFGAFDRGILNMLYHPLIRPGMTKLEAARVLPAIAAEVQARLR